MQPNRRERPWLTLMAGVGWLGLALQLLVAARVALHNGRSPLQGVLEALCYFTVLTNTLVSLIATARLAGSRVPALLTTSGTAAAGAVYIFVVGLIYSLLLRSLWAPSGLHKIADIILHDLMPILYVLWWLRFARSGRLAWTQPLWWLGYPLAYLGFSVLRGALTGRCLYPFADISVLGVATVLGNAALLLGLFLVLGLIAVAIDRTGRSSRRV